MAAAPAPSPPHRAVFLPLLRIGIASEAAILKAIPRGSTNASAHNQHLWDLKRWHSHSGQVKELSNLIARRDASWRNWHGVIWPGVGWRRALTFAAF